MKKIIKVALVLVAAATLFSSCKSHEKCPAYGQISKPNKHIRAVG